MGFFLTRMAKAQGFLDPRVLFGQLQRFARPSEVWVPSELLRSGMTLQARGVLNSQAIQHNLDWIWPFWVYHQFNPHDPAFLPRAFNLSHINLTHRNWTALGVPDYADYPLVDPRGLVTPFFDGWSLDAWIIAENGASLIPAQMPYVHQQLNLDGLRVLTSSTSEGMYLRSQAEVIVDQSIPKCVVCYQALTSSQAWLLVCVRPFNTEGVSFVHDLDRLSDEEGWLVNGEHNVRLRLPPQSYAFSNYHDGDIARPGPSPREQVAIATDKIHCPVGMATAAALYALSPHQNFEVTVEVPLSKAPVRTTLWKEHLHNYCRIEVPDQSFQCLYETALRTLILHSPGDVYPGPFTYKRFWFRDAAFILDAMLATGLMKNMEAIVHAFPKRQTPLGYFKSQDGEWDSNGQALWIIHRYSTMAPAVIGPDLLKSVAAGAAWIRRKRLSGTTTGAHAGLMPAGFSAEHLGPSDFYYWDDFWSVAGLRAAAALMVSHREVAEGFAAEATELTRAIEQSLEHVRQRQCRGIPASPYRRMDGGAVGSLAASYPLRLLPPDDERMKCTVDFLLEKYLFDGVYYHEVSHSGINAYLSLHLAQVLLRAGDPRFFEIVRKVAEWASPTGQWPEAIHPQTKGGCMGDGQHVWAAAEWVLMLRNMFVREEKDTLILCSGLPAEWLEKGQILFLGPTRTSFGKISVTVHTKDRLRVAWAAEWHAAAPTIEVHLPGGPKGVAEPGMSAMEFGSRTAGGVR